MTPPQYLRWANARAKELNVEFLVPESTIADMIASRLAVHGDVYFDDGVCGNLASRPALDQLLKRIASDMGVSHLFIPNRKRLYRPDNPLDGVELESTIRKQGVTIVYMDKVAKPLTKHQRIDLVDMLDGLIDYDSAGKDRQELAQKILRAQVQLAQGGFSTGGRAPYGFRRWLVRIDGAPVREVQNGEITKLPGHHVAWLPVPDDHLEMIVIRRIREMLKTIPAMRIVRMLNSESIPSPDAGRTRHDNGVEHLVSGKWNQTSVVNIGRSLLHAAVSTYGIRSMGDQLRMSPEGPRALTDDDFRPDGKPKVVRNAPDLVLRNRAKFEPVVAIKEHEELQRILDERGKTQRGKPRARNPNKNPLGARIFDMECGWLMYRNPYNGSFRYVCGKYQQHHGCNHNRVDGPTATRVVLAAISQRLSSPRAITKLRERFVQLAQLEKSQPQKHSNAQLRQSLAQLEADQAKVSRNMALSETPEQRAAVAEVFEDNDRRMKQLKSDIQALERITRPNDIDAEVEKAMAQITNLPELLMNGADLSAAGEAIRVVNARLFVRFRKVQLKRRCVNQPAGAIITFGDAAPPIRLYDGPTAREASPHLAAASAASPGGPETLPDRVPSGREGKSLGNVSRGDRTSIELFSGSFSGWTKSLIAIAQALVT